MKISIIPLLLLLLLSPLAVPATSAAEPTAYDLLASYNFPVGLLPQGITGYDLDNSTGIFHVYMPNTCSFALEGSYQLKYKSKIGGRISENRITDLNGISVKVWFLWLNIVEVGRSGDDIEFSVGIASAGFPIDNFFESPQCGCGLNCNGVDGLASRIMSDDGLVSSI